MTEKLCRTRLAIVAPTSECTAFSVGWIKRFGNKPFLGAPISVEQPIL